MKKHLLYLRYLLRHKWFVIQAGLKTKAPLWRLIIHDWSKFLPCEWRPYVEYFYHDPDWQDVITEHLKPFRQAWFDQAWLHHQHANPHHWQHWVLHEDSGALKLLDMPEHFIREMVADWAGAGRAITGRWDVLDWYAKNYENIQLNQNDRFFVEALITTHFNKEQTHAKSN